MLSGGHSAESATDVAVRIRVAFPPRFTTISTRISRRWVMTFDSGSAIAGAVDNLDRVPRRAALWCNSPRIGSTALFSGGSAMSC